MFSIKTVALYTRGVRCLKTLQHPLNKGFGELQCLTNEILAGMGANLDT